MNSEGPLTKAGPHRTTAFGEQRVHGDIPVDAASASPFASFAANEFIGSDLGRLFDIPDGAAPDAADDAVPEGWATSAGVSSTATIVTGFPWLVTSLRQLGRRVRDRGRVLVRMLRQPGSRSRGRRRQGGRVRSTSRRKTSGSASRDGPSEPSDPPSPRSVDGRPSWWRAALGLIRHPFRPPWGEIEAEARGLWEVPK